MKSDDLSDAERAAIKAAMLYWIERWDWEWPIFLGLEKVELQRLVDHWPRVESENEKRAALAVDGALRELRYGASAVPKSQVQAVCGRSFEAADKLSKRVCERVSHVL